MTTQTFNISLPRDLVTAMDTVAKQEYRNRSDFIREAVRVYLADMMAWNSLFSYGNKQAKLKSVRSDEDVEKKVAEYRKGK